MAPHPEADRLAAYRAKRSAERTPEPFGSAAARPRLFVVQEHRARRAHFDLRLEWQGVMWSWAVPKGPSLDPAQKRLAVHVEDHPLDYADFEGSIPEGNYGAGSVIVWDKGRWVPVEDPEAGIANGKLLFDLYGYKLRGRFTLVRTGGARRKRDAPVSKEWLLIKKPDAFASATARLSPHSIHSGRTVEDVAANASPEAALLRDATKAGALAQNVAAARARPMLAEAWDEPFSAKGWFFEVKYDGYRVIAAREDGRARLFYRSGREATALFPEIAVALAALPVSHVVLDGELVVHDATGRPSFQMLQGRAQATGREAARASVETPAALALFDLLGVGDLDLRALPLRTRRALLARIVPPVGPLQLAPHWEERGKAVFGEIEKLGLEGMVAKRADAPYRAGRSPAWRKIRIQKTGDFAIVGWSAPRGARSGFGALHVAARDAQGLRYVGRVGSGFTERQLVAIRAALEADERATAPCHGVKSVARSARWVEPRLIAEIRFTEWTSDGSLRQPVFLRLRDDKSIDEIDEFAGAASQSMPIAEAEEAEPERDEPTLTNLDKVFWPADGYTKGDLLDYYRAIAPWLLPYLKDRPLVLTRFPDGIDGKSFFQKDAPSWAPEWLRTEKLWSEHGGRDLRYFICDSVESLLYIANMGAIPLHVWSSRVGNLARPDWSILDIDPKGAPFAGAVAIARAIHELADAIALPTYVKTSGSEGIHVLVPLGGRMSFEQSRRLAELIASVVVGELADIATLERNPRKRGGKVYLDTLQNGHGKLLAAPFCARPLPGAPVSMPLRWSEVNARLDPRRFTIRNAVARMKRLGEDPLLGVFDPSPDLGGALGRLIERVRANGR